MDVVQLGRQPPDHPRQPRHVCLRAGDIQRARRVAEVHLRVNDQEFHLHLLCLPLIVFVITRTLYPKITIKCYYTLSFRYFFTSFRAIISRMPEEEHTYATDRAPVTGGKPESGPAEAAGRRRRCAPDGSPGRASPADIVEAMDDLTPPEALAVFNWLDNERAAEVLDELDSETVSFLTSNAPSGRIAELLDHLPMDDAAEVVSEAEPDAGRGAAGRPDRPRSRRCRRGPQAAGLPRRDGRPADDRQVCRRPARRDGRRRRWTTCGGTPTMLETINEVYVLDEDRRLRGVSPDPPDSDGRAPQPRSASS